MNTKKEPFRPDDPICRQDQDKLQRYSFAKRIAQIVSDSRFPKSVVVGIYGKWGEGKSSVLNFIREEIADNVVIVNFNPWLFSDQGQLLKSFFEAMAIAVGESLQTKKEKIAGLFYDYADSVSSLTGKWIHPGVFNLGKRVTEKLKKDSAEDLKSKVNSIIVEANVNFVVFVDDIDRLDADEIQLVFKLVKLVGDFPRTSYILSFDDEIIAAALGIKYAQEGKKIGYDFLEKIIQVPLHLPKASKKALRDYTLELLFKSLDSLPIRLDQKSTGEFIKQFDETFLAVLDNPRLGVRLANSIAFSIPLLDGEAHVSDLMTIEAIKVFFPELYHFIRNNSPLLLKAFSTTESQYGDGLYSKTEVKKAIENHLKMYDTSLKQKIEGLLIDLFPQVKTVFQNYIYPDDLFMKWHRDKRICSPQYFSRYFSYVVQKGDISDVVFGRLLEGLASTPLDELKSKFIRTMEIVQPSELIYKFRNWERHLPPEDSIALAKVLASLGNKFADDDQPFFKLSSFGITGYFIATLLKHLPAPQILKASLEVLEQTQPLALCFEIEQSLTDSNQHILDSHKFSQTDFSSIRKLIVKRFKELLRNDTTLNITHETNFQLIIYWWFIYDNKQELLDYIRNEIENDPMFSFNLLKAFTPTIHSFGQEQYKVMKSDFSLNTYADLSQIADPEIILNNLEKIFGEIKPAEKLPTSRTSLSDTDIRSIYKMVHIKALSGEISLPEPWSRAKDIESNE